MNAGIHSGDGGEPLAAGGLGVDDVFFTLFRHKWLLLTFMCLGIVAAGAVRFVKPPLYQSKAKLNVPYIVDTKAVNTANPETQIISTASGGLAAIEAEIEILRSLDVCALAADSVGPENVLAKKGGGSDRMAAAGVIASGLLVDPPRTATISVTFQHPDREIVQLVMNALIKAYAFKHRQVHSGEGIWDDHFIAQRDDWGEKLVQTEAALRQLRSEAKLISMDETKTSYQLQISKLQERLFDATTELAERKAQMGDLDLAVGAEGEITASNTNIPSETLEDYAVTVSRLEYLTRHVRQLLSEGGLKEAHRQVQAARAEIGERTEHKAALEQEYPALAVYAVDSAGVTTNSVVSTTAELRRLTTSVAVFGTLLSNVQFQAAQLMELEPKITELERQRELQEANFKFYSGRLEQVRSGESSNEGKMINLSVIQSPSPPGLDSKKLLKLTGMALAGCIAVGLGLAFFIDLVLDRTIKRSTDVKRLLRLPVMLTIPHTNWSVGWWPARLGRGRNGKVQSYDPKFNQNVPAGGAGIAPWNPVHHLRQYTDGLRERLITYFEVNQLTHRPKLVAVTSCSAGVGVTTLSTGLAASLSMTGDGNVLLVDMNAGEGVSHSFHRGKPGCGLSEMPEPEDAPAATASNHYPASVPAGGSVPENPSSELPTVFSDVMPKLKVSGYDYIVFDMPLVSQTSVTPRMSGHMDMVLLVIESEKTRQHLAVESTALMREAQAKVATVLNKCKAHVPAALSTGF
ncbi:MAG: hypothetical protein IH623_03740 [Verrucomicrobia bacterium]|nr:hypothetical protein [Verrucomicrobiota bacterium]